MTENKRRLSASYDFDMEEVVAKCNNSSDPNVDAWKQLHSAMCTPEFFNDKSVRRGKYKDILYPVTKAEVDEMEARLSLAEHSQESKDESFTAVLNEMKSIVQWSKTRHFNCSYIVLISFAIIIAVAGFFLPSGKTEILDSNLKKVQEWGSRDTSLTPEQCYEGENPILKRYDSPANYKAYLLYDLAKEIKEARKSVEYTTNIKKKIEIQSDLSDKLIDFYIINAKTSKELKTQVIEEFDSKIAEQNSVTEMSRGLYFLMIILLPLYLISCYQYGYNISRFIRFRESMDKLSVLLGSVAAVAGVAAPAYIKKSSGASEGEGNKKKKTGVIIALGGLLLVIFCSAIALFIMTMNGLYYNYIAVKKKNSVTLFDNNAPKGTFRYYFNGIMNVAASDYMNLYTLDGRENRTSYAIFFAINTLVFGGLLLLGINMVFLIPFYLMVFLASMVRRVHDIGYSGKLVILGVVLVVFLPYVGVGLLGATALVPGTKGENIYGDVEAPVFS